MSDLVFWLIVIGSFLAILMGFMFYMMWQARTFKHRVRIKEVTKSQIVIKDHFARDWRDKEGVAWWRLDHESNKEKRLIPVPPLEAISINVKAKKCVEAYRMETGDIIFIKDSNKLREIPIDLFKNIPSTIMNIKNIEEKNKKIEEWRRGELLKWQKENGVTGTYTPLTTNHRIALINQIRKAEIKRGKDWKEHIPVYVSLAALVIIVIALMIFWGDIAKPVLEGKAMNLAIVQSQEKMLNKLDQMDKNIQQIQGQQAGDQTATPNQPPN